MTPGGLHLPDTAEKDVLQYGRVVAAGDECKYVEGGEIVLFNSRAGFQKKINERPYYFVHENTLAGLVPGRFDPDASPQEEVAEPIEAS